MSQPMMDLNPPRQPYPGETFLWVVWHRLRRHWTQPSGYLIHHGRSARIWRCSTCGTQRAGRAPGFIAWKEQG